MSEVKTVNVSGIPSSLDKTAILAFDLRFKSLFKQVVETSGISELTLTVSSADHVAVGAARQQKKIDSKPVELDVDPNIFRTSDPRWSFDRLIVNESTREELINALCLIELETKIFDEWCLREIEPSPRTAINFHGPSGTGKTLAAHAAASYLGKQICQVSYADVESKYHGDGPKNVVAVFAAAESSGALLFFDEADSLLSRRLTSVNQGSEQAINSMRSQLLICLERHRGVVVFATNLVENYDPAFNTRVRHIGFSLPNEDCRQRIWRGHMPAGLPLDADVDCDELAELFSGVCGREIKNAVIAAAVDAARRGAGCVAHQDFVRAMQGLISSRIEGAQQGLKVRPVSATEFDGIGSSIRAAIAQTENTVCKE